jgi:hypothetical protein
VLRRTPSSISLLCRNGRLVVLTSYLCDTALGVSLARAHRSGSPGTAARARLSAAGGERPRAGARRAPPRRCRPEAPTADAGGLHRFGIAVVANFAVSAPARRVERLRLLRDACEAMREARWGSGREPQW